MHSALGGRSVPGAPVSTKPAIVTIFARGGIDPLNAIIPHGDQANYANLRPNLHFTKQGTPVGARGPAGNSLQLSNYAQVGIHPGLQEIKSLIESLNMAVVHRVGNTVAPQRSHFTEMHLLETGLGNYNSSAQGWLPQCTPSLSSGAVMPSVSLSNRMMRMYQGDGPNNSALIQGAYESTSGTRSFDIPFGEPNTPSELIADGVERSLNNPGNYPLAGQAINLRGTMATAIDLQAQLRNSTFAHNGSLYPSQAGDTAPWDVAKYGTFFDRLEEGMHYLRNDFTDCVGVELGGWDTHRDQLVRHNELMPVLARAIRSAYDDLTTIGRPFVVLVVSEFGRTLADNGSGTDHGVGGFCLVAGSNVNGGVYNCSQGGWSQLVGTPSGVKPWRNLNLPASQTTYENALEPATDFRTVLVEIAKKHFGVPAGQLINLPDVGSEWDMVNSSTQQRFTELGIL
ncbi:MAG: DUF1501 domain-containing protein [Planctomycetota bacterium]